MEKRIHANYEIINTMQLENAYGTHMEIVMGYNKKAAAPYVTWQYYPKTDSYNSGQYFINKDSATKDFFERGLLEMDLDLREAYRKENALADIECVLESEFREKEVEGLLRNEDFVSNALHRYYNIDHSAENEALLETLENLYAEMVKNEKVFSFESMDKLKDLKSAGQMAEITLKDGSTVYAEFIYYDPKQSMTTFYAESSKDQDGRFFEVKDVALIRLDGEIVFPNNIEDKEIKKDALDAQIFAASVLAEEHENDSSFGLPERDGR